MRAALVAVLTALALLVAPVAHADDIELTPGEQRYLSTLTGSGIKSRSGDPVNLVTVGYEICEWLYAGYTLSLAVDTIYVQSNKLPGGLTRAEAGTVVSAAVVNLCPGVARFL